MNLDVAAAFDHLAGDLVAENKSCGRRGAAAHHVLIAAADVGGDDLQNDAVLALSRSQREFGEVDRLNLDLPGSHVGNTSIGCHSNPSLLVNMSSRFSLNRDGGHLVKAMHGR